LSWQSERLAEHAERLSNNTLPNDFPYEVQRGNAEDALTALALGESIRRDIGYLRALRVRDAVKLGATWKQVSASLDVTPDAARELLRQWADNQHRLHQGDVADGRTTPLGLSPEQHAAVLALTELGDDESVRRV
jgi:hypothetical protein